MDKKKSNPFVGIISMLMIMLFSSYQLVLISTYKGDINIIMICIFSTAFSVSFYMLIKKFFYLIRK